MINPALPVALVFAIAFPTALIIWWKRRTGEKLWCFIAGALCFFLFAYILEPLLHQVCITGDNPAAKAITGSPLLYTLYASFAAGIFEETGRLFGFKVLLKNRQGKECSVAYGIGHGGIEVILILGMTYAVYLLAEAGVSFGDEETTAKILSFAGSIPLSTAFLAMFERISAMMIHVGLSMIMFVAARRSDRFRLYPVSICIHALADAPACLYQQGIITSLFFIESWAFVLGIAVLIAGRRILDANICSPEAE